MLENHHNTAHWDAEAAGEYERIVKAHQVTGTPALLAQDDAIARVEKSLADRRDPDRLLKAAGEIAKSDRLVNDRAAEADINRLVEQIRKNDPSITREQAYVDAISTHEGQGLYARLRRHELRKAGFDVDQDLEPPASVPVPVALEKAADALQAHDEGLTREQALLRACEAQPELYASWGDA